MPLVLEQPVALDRGKCGRLVERHLGRRDQPNLALERADTGCLLRAVDCRLYDDNFPVQGGGQPLHLLVRGAPGEVRQLLVEQRRPPLVERDKSPIPDEEMVGMGTDALTANQPPDQTGRPPAGAGGKRDEPAWVALGPVANRALEGRRIRGVANPGVLGFEQRQRGDSVGQAGEGGCALRRPGCHPFARVRKAADPVPVSAPGRVRLPGESGQDVKRPLALEQRGARERGIVEVRLDDENRRLRKPIR
jgi:hypothetical protein